MSSFWLLVAADALLIIHVLFVGFVVLGLFAIYLGYALRWSWVHNVWIRTVHLLAIGIVVAQAWMGVICPLTIWEMSLRQAASDETYAGSFIQYWLHQLLYYQAPDWVFVLCYSVFGALVLASWFVVRPVYRRDQDE